MFRPDVDAVPSSTTPIHVIGTELSLSMPGGDCRLAGARLLERHLLRLGQVGVLVERRLTPGLERMRSRSLHRLLGYVRLGDYLVERLGMSLRRCQAILRLERALERLPRLRGALQAGEVSLSKAEVVAGAASAETEEAWIERSRRLTVAGLREAAAAARAAGGDASGSASGGREDADGPGTVPAETIEQDEAGRLVSFSAPARALAIWHWTLDLVRRVAGQQEPAWRCVEYLAAEFLSGVPDMSGGVDARPAAPGPAEARGRYAGTEGDSGLGPRGTDSPAPVRAGDASGLAAWNAASAAIREAFGSPDPGADPEVILSGSQAAPGMPGVGKVVGDGDELDAWELDERLRRLVRIRQSLAWRQGRLLATLASLGLHRKLGFATLDDWVMDRLPMSPRRARYLVSLDRRLRGLPLLADAYRRGLVTWCQARLLVRVVQTATQTPWIRYARRVTVRRLEVVVIASEVAAAESAGAAAGPPAHVRAPAHIGASAEVQMPAHIGAPLLPPIEPSSDQAAGAAADGGPLHTSAPFPGPAAVDVASTDRLIRRRIAFWAPLEVAALWDSALRACRTAAGSHLEDWECFLVFVQALRDTWENLEDPHWRRRYRIFERDGWRCMAPGCSSRSGLNEHHIVFRSQQGDSDEGNLVTLCIGHHQLGVHERHIRCFGRAPGALWWDLGVRPGGRPLVRYFGDLVVAHRPHVRIGQGSAASRRSAGRGVG